MSSLSHSRLKNQIKLTGTNSYVFSNDIFGNCSSTSREIPSSRASCKSSGVKRLIKSSTALGTKIGSKTTIEIPSAPSSPKYGISSVTQFNFSLAAVH